MEQVHTLLWSSQRSGRFIAHRVLPRVSSGLCEAFTASARAVESDRISDESSRVPSPRVGVDVRTEY